MGEEDYLSKVHIESWRTVKEGIFSYTVFVVDCVLASKKRWRVEKRYRHFLGLHQEIIKKIPEVASFSFPEKTWLNCARAVIYYRAYLFEDYLNDLLRILPRPAEVDAFLEAPRYLRRILSRRSLESLESAGTRRHRRPLGPRDFHLVRTIGRGAFGVVFLVVPAAPDLGGPAGAAAAAAEPVPLAMKVLRKDEIRRRGQVAHAKREQRILKSLDHPFVIRLHSTFQSPDKLYMVMEYCEGGELYNFIKSKKRLTEEEMKFYCIEIGCALQYLHSHNIMFRDLKPENVLLTSQGHVKLADFGLAKRFPMDINTSDIRSGTFCGTPEYLAPEMLMNKLFKVRYGPSVDWWTFGVVLYEAVAGRPPFRDPQFGRLCRKILKQPLRFPRNMQPELSPAAASFVQGLLRKNARHRLACGAAAGGGGGGGGGDDGGGGDAGQLSGLDGLRGHPFLAGVDWERAERGELEPPIVPNQADYVAGGSVQPSIKEEEERQNAKGKWQQAMKGHALVNGDMEVDEEADDDEGQSASVAEDNLWGYFKSNGVIMGNHSSNGDASESARAGDGPASWSRVSSGLDLSEARRTPAAAAAAAAAAGGPRGAVPGGSPAARRAGWRAAYASSGFSSAQSRTSN